MMFAYWLTGEVAAACHVEPWSIEVYAIASPHNDHAAVHREPSEASTSASSATRREYGNSPPFLHVRPLSSDRYDITASLGVAGSPPTMKIEPLFDFKNVILPP